MKHNYYFPKSIGKQQLWIHNYKAKIEIEGPVLELTPTKIQEEITLCDEMTADINAAAAAKSVMKQMTQKRNATIKKNMGKLQKKIRSHKANDNYSNGIGKSLGIIGTEKKIEFDKVKSKMALIKSQAGVIVKFSLEDCEGGDIFCKRDSDADFILLKRVNHPLFEDDRPLAEGASAESRQYYVILVYKDKQVGLTSDIASITI